MSGPPPDVPPKTLWAELQELPRPHKIVDFPRKRLDGKAAGQVAIWVLTQEEQMACAVAAEKFVRTYLKESKAGDHGYDETYRNAVCVEILWRACRDETNLNMPAFPNPKQMRMRMTAEECARLLEHYYTVQLELGPVVTTMTATEMDAWIERLAEGGSAFPFDLLSSDMQKILVLGMAFRLHSSRTATTSPGSQLEETPSGAEAVPSNPSASPTEPEATPVTTTPVNDGLVAPALDALRAIDTGLDALLQPEK